MNNEYKQWLTDLKSRIRQSQIKAAVKVNTELLRLYWDLGQDIVIRQMETTWGSGFFEQFWFDLADRRSTIRMQNVPHRRKSHSANRRNAKTTLQRQNYSTKKLAIPPGLKLKPLALFPNPLMENT